MRVCNLIAFAKSVIDKPEGSTAETKVAVPVSTSTSQDLTVSGKPVVCPKCGSHQLYDNRTTKKNPKGPDFKCKACEHAGWLRAGQYGEFISWAK